MPVYLFRHGESQGNADRVYQGRIDSPLTARGSAQAQTLGRWLKQQGIVADAVFSSPLSRAMVTATIAAETAGWPAPRSEPLIVEYDAGSLQGLSVEQASELWPGYSERPLEMRGDFAEFGGESYEDAQARLGSFIRQVELHYLPEKTVAAFLHGGSLYQLTKLWCSYPTPRHYFMRIENCCCFKLERRTVAGHDCCELHFMLPLAVMEQMLETGAG